MKKYFYRLLSMAAMAAFAAACGEPQTDVKEESETQETEIIMETEELEEMFVPAEEADDVPTVITEYSEEEEYPELAQFLANYYEIPEDYQGETRYYYNFVDLDEDGRNEIFTIVIGEYTEGENGDPALLLAQGNGEPFIVIDDFAEIRTPVTVSESMTNGWHDIIFKVYGKGVEDGYLICHYNPDGGYQTEINELVAEMEPISGTQILSNNLIDDMDQGRYFTLKK